jgi:hypothetical protein
LPKFSLPEDADAGGVLSLEDYRWRVRHGVRAFACGGFC